MSPTTILLTLVLYLLVLYGVAALSAHHSDSRTFFTGNRKIAWWVVALGMIGAPMSGVSFVSVPGSVATDGFTYLQMVAGFTVGQVVVACWLVPLFYREGVTSLYEWLNRRFGPESQRTGALLFLLSKGILSALKLYVVCLMLQELLFRHWGTPFWGCSLLMVGLVWGYTLRGGVRSVVWTDILQTLCLVGAVVVTTWVVATRLLPVEPNLWQEVGDTLRERTLLLDDPMSARAFGKMFVGGIFVLIAMTGLDQDMMQRNLSCPTPRAAQRNILLTALAQAVVITLLLVMGELLYRYAAAERLPLPTKSDEVFGAIATGGTLPLAVGILFILGLVSSTYSTAGSALTALTTSAIYDLLPARVRRAEVLERNRKMIHTVLALGMGGLILLFDWWAEESLINLLFRIVSYTYGPILGLFLYGALSHRQIQGRKVAIVALVAPILSILLQQLLLYKTGYTIGSELILYNALITMTGLHIISVKLR